MKTKRPKRHGPRLLVANDKGEFFDHPDLLMAGQSWDEVILTQQEDTVLAPESLQVVFLPGHLPVGIDPATKKQVTVTSFFAQGRTFTPHAVAAITPTGYMRHLLPAMKKTSKAPTLPLRSYCALGISGSHLRLCASHIDSNTHWDPARFQRPDMTDLIKRLQKRFPGNQVLKQLARCATEYFCCTAKNIFLGTFEGALPISPRCNARCLGCISEQSGEVESPQHRLLAPPIVDDIVQIAVFHLQRAKPAMVSFGQGCEGEPLTQGDLLIRAISAIRSQTNKGTIHLNTNGSKPELVHDLSEAGLQSVRVSIFSAREKPFQQYHRASYDLQTVEEFCRNASEHGIRVSLNLLTFPGFTDRAQELDALVEFIHRTGSDMVQIRNLDLDPANILKNITPANGPILGLKKFLKTLRHQIPNLDVGSFNRFLD